jgi:endogenous inhibitor of DNA gyrase (YacG/DUF329 family)
MRCPTCQTEFARSDTAFPPFCSERCKLIDLSHWLDGGYVIPGEAADIPASLEELEGGEEPSD